MNGRPKGRQGDLQARKEWTVRLNRFSSAKTPKQRQAVIETALKINPGGTIREMLQAWGYSASARGRKPKDAPEVKPETTARERLERALTDLFGKTPTPVPSLYAKLAGRIEITVADAWRILAALIFTWPEPLKENFDAKTKSGRDLARTMGETFIRELLADLSAHRSREWTAEEMKTKGFQLVDEERVAARTFVSEAGQKEGALIVAGAKSILIGEHPVTAMRQFQELTSQFIAKEHKGLLIFVFNSAIFEAGKDGFNLIYNIGLLSSALISFALFPENYDYKQPIQEYNVDWSAWRTLSRRCCVVIRKPPLIDSSSGQFLKLSGFDDFVGTWRPEQNFEHLGEVRGFVRFESTHVLPRNYPPTFGQEMAGKDLYWDVIVRPTYDEPNGLQVEYFTPPLHNIEATAESQEKHEDPGRSPFAPPRGRPTKKTSSIEEDVYYLVRQQSPGVHYDDAHKAIYRAVRGRLHMDTGESHSNNLNAAAALRQIGYEVLPISTMLSLFPLTLHFAGSEESPTKDKLQRGR
jgi:hypothetical protein